jgi:hypothetical protein
MDRRALVLGGLPGVRCWLGGWDGVELDGEAECVGLADDTAHGTFGVQASEVISAQLVVVDVVR